MITRDYINPEFPYLSPEDSVNHALTLFEEFKAFHIPVIQDKKFIGLMDEAILLNAMDYSAPISSFEVQYNNVHVSASEHVYSAARIASQHNVSTVAVVDADKSYLGAIDAFSFNKLLFENAGITEAGGIIVLSMKTRDYSLSSLGQIVESNGHQILSATTYSPKENIDHMRVTLKISSDELAGISADLERHGHEIIASFQKDTTDINYERLDQLFKYLDI